MYADAALPPLLARTVLVDEVEFLAVKAFSSGTRVANRHLAPLDLRVRSYAVLAVTCADVEITQRELARQLDLDPSQIVALVDVLESRALVERIVAPTDRRSRVIRATSAGRELLTRARAATRAAEAESLAALDAAERRTLHALLHKIVFAA